MSHSLRQRQKSTRDATNGSASCQDRTESIKNNAFGAARDLALERPLFDDIDAEIHDREY
jgi:hypothetical protein